MADPIATSIIDDILSTLEGVTVANGYERDFRTVARNDLPFDTVEYDAVFFEGFTESYEDYAVGVEENLMTITLSIWVFDADDLSKATDKAVADIRKCLRVDETRNDKAYRTRVIERSPTFDTEYEHVGAAMVLLEVHYQTEYGNPYGTI